MFPTTANSMQYYRHLRQIYNKSVRLNMKHCKLYRDVGYLTQVFGKQHKIV